MKISPPGRNNWEHLTFVKIYLALANIIRTPVASGRPAQRTGLATQTKPTDLGFQFLESEQADLVCVAAISNRQVYF